MFYILEQGIFLQDVYKRDCPSSPFDWVCSCSLIAVAKKLSPQTKRSSAPSEIFGNRALHYWHQNLTSWLQNLDLAGAAKRMQVPSTTSCALARIETLTGITRDWISISYRYTSTLKHICRFNNGPKVGCESEFCCLIAFPSVKWFD